MATFPFPGGARQSITWRDAKGNTARSSFYINQNGATGSATGALVGSLLAAIDALTNAALQSYSGSASGYGVAQYGAAPAEYQPIQVKAKMTYQDASGALHRFQIPSPIAAMFLADLETVDPANSLVVALNGVLTHSSAPASGTPYFSGRQGLFLANFLGGVLTSTKLRRKSNIYVLTPALTPGEPEE